MSVLAPEHAFDRAAKRGTPRVVKGTEVGPMEVDDVRDPQHTREPRDDELAVEAAVAGQVDVNQVDLARDTKPDQPREKSGQPERGGPNRALPARNSEANGHVG